MKKLFVILMVLLLFAELILIFCNMAGIPLSDISQLPSFIIEAYKF